MSLKYANPRLEEPKGLSEKTSAWNSGKLSGPRVVPILERFSRDINTRRLTSRMIVKESLAQRLTPLQDHSSPPWDYRAGNDELRLRSEDLPSEELNRVVAILLGSDPGDLPEALDLLYHLDDWADLIVMLPVFDERGLFPAKGSGLVEVSSGDTSGREGSENIVEVSVVISSRTTRTPRGGRVGPARHAVRVRAHPQELRGWFILGASHLRRREA
ncbi:hypothetical protein D1007_53496 [Hordeum vulgare]|nr:hypothetical protein D1007_53496 [Hordeum vulgare]